MVEKDNLQRQSQMATFIRKSVKEHAYVCPDNVTSQARFIHVSESGAVVRYGRIEQLDWRTFKIRVDHLGGETIAFQVSIHEEGDSPVLNVLDLPCEGSVRRVLTSEAETLMNGLLDNGLPAVELARKLQSHNPKISEQLFEGSVSPEPELLLELMGSINAEAADC